MLNKRIITELDDAWMDISVNEEFLIKPLDILFDQDPQIHMEKIAWLMCQPEYFSFTCKYLLGIELLPFQSAILAELWRRKFPMLIMTRGGGKAECVDNLLLTESGWVRMGDISVGDRVYSRNGKLCDVTHIHPQGKKQVYRVELLDGRYVDCCEDHLWVVKTNGEDFVIPVKEMIKNPTQYKIPNCEPIQFEGYDYKEAIEFIEGLFGNNKEIIQNDEGMANDIVSIARSLGITCKKELCGGAYKLSINDEKYVQVKSITRLNEYKEMQCITVNSEDHTYITKDYVVTHNSFLLGGIYTLLRCLILDGRKLVGVGAAFRQSKVLFEYAEGIWNNAPVLRSLCDANSGPRKEPDMCRMVINNSRATFLPIGDGCLSPDTQITYEDGFGTILSGSGKTWGNGKFRDIEYRIDNGIKPTKVITTKKGFSYEATYNHAMKVLSDNEIIWKRTDEMRVGDSILIDKTKRWHNGDFECSLDEAYSIGVSITKEFPENMLKAKKEIMAMCIKGIICSKGDFNWPTTEISGIELKLAKQIQYVLLHFGVLSNLLENGNLIVLMKEEVEKDMIVDEIKSISDSECYTYDIHVPEGNEYCANGFYSHNSRIRGQRGQDILSDEFACLRYNTIIQTDEGLIEIGDYLNTNAYDLLNMELEMETPERIIKTPKTDVYKIETQNGYSFECSNIHQVMTQKGWKLAKDLTKDDNLELDVNEYFPERYISKNGRVLDEKLGWLIGILLSEGCVTNRNYVTLSNTDKRLIDQILEKYTEYDWKTYYKEEYVDKRGFNCLEKWTLNYNDTKFRTDLYDFGVTYSIANEKTIPKDILMSPRSVVVAFLSGLFEGDGSAFNYMERDKKRVGIAYYSSSKRLMEVLQILLLKFGVVCSVNKRNRKNNRLSDNDNYLLSIRGENSRKVFDLLKVIKWEDKFDNADFLVKKPHIRQNGERLVCSTNRGNKNVHIGTYDTEEECIAAFNEYWAKTRPVMRVKSVVKLDEQDHLYDFYLPKTHSFIGNGFVQHNSIPVDIFETVIAGFASVSSTPANNVKAASKKRKAKELGVSLENADSINNFNLSNQIILSGTAYYDFNHFAQYWKKWKGIVESKGDEKALAETFNGEVPPDFNWRDYSVIRIPYDKLPEGFMDEGQISRSKATIHSGIFLMENQACGVFDTPIVTKHGIKNLGEVKVGDLVLTHKGRFRKVLETMSRQYDGYLVEIKSGYYKNLLFTPEHPFWVEGDDFCNIKNIEELSVASLKELCDHRSHNGANLTYEYGISIGESINENSGKMDPNILFSNTDFIMGFAKGLFSKGKTIRLVDGDLAHQIKLAISHLDIKTSLLFSGLFQLSLGDSNGLTKKMVPYSGLVYNLEVEEDHSYSTPNATVHNCFSTDSQGFFKRTLIESCVPSRKNPIEFPSGYVSFVPQLIGSPISNYVIGVDPASERDNFSIVVLEILPDHRRIVYCWTTTRKSFHERRKKDTSISETDFYSFCARKIRDLAKTFQTERIAIDSGGGGIAILEALHDKDKLLKGEIPFWPIITEKPSITDGESGRHIIEVCQFSDYKWLREANHGLRKDFEDKVLIFPEFDSATIGISIEQDNIAGREYDTLEDCVMEIEELKDELSIIEVKATESGRERWDTPEVKTGIGKKGRLRKDRYSALLMANMAARTIARTPDKEEYRSDGGFSHGVRGPQPEKSFIGPAWFTEAMEDVY